MMCSNAKIGRVLLVVALLGVFRCGAASAASLDADAVRTRALAGDGEFVVNVTLPRVGDVDLQVRRFRVLSRATRFNVAGPGGESRDIPVRHDDFVFLRGDVIGHEGSHVFIALTTRGVGGRIELGPARPTFVIGENGDGRVRIRQAGAMAMPSAAPTCGTADAPPVRGAGGGLGSVTARPVIQAEVAVDSDQELRGLFDTNDAAIEYLVTLHALCADVYIRDIETTLLLTFVRIWETPDPFTSDNPMGSLTAEWYERMPEVPRHLVHLISGRVDLPYSGQANRIGISCAGGNFAWSGYMQGIAASSGIYQRDALLAAHEIGHVLGAPHTHALAIDNCPDETEPPHRGTVMSYCSLVYTGERTIDDFRIHRGVREGGMETRLLDAECYRRDCNLNGVPDAEEIDADGAIDSNGDGIIDDCQDCNRDGVPDPQQAEDLPDTNGNGRPDQCEPDCGSDGSPDVFDDETDANGNWIADACEPDRNGNGVSDLLDINTDMTLDLNRNTIIDAFEDCNGDGTDDLTALSGANAVWIADLSGASLSRYIWPIGTAQLRSDNAGLVEPKDVVVTEDLRVFVSSGDGRVIEFDVAGRWLHDLVPVGGGIQDPTGMAIAPDGNLLVADRATDSVHRVDVDDGSLLSPAAAPADNGLSAPFGIAVDDAGVAHVAGMDGEIRRYDANGVNGFLGSFIPEVHARDLVDPRGVAFLPNGDLVVADYGRGGIWRYDGRTGDPLGRFERTGTLPLVDPWTIRIGPDGGVYVSRARTNPDGEASLAARLRKPRIVHLDPETGGIVRAFVQGRDADVINSTGFDFIPDLGLDCNRNLLPDACDLASGFSGDANQNSIPDECERDACRLDIDDDGRLTVVDLLLYLDWWLVDDPEAEVTGDEPADVTVLDLLLFVRGWLAGSAAGLCDR